MYEIKNITQDEWHFYIERNDSVFVAQRKRTFDATDSSLTPNEELINALCRKLLSPSTTGEECGMTANDIFKTLYDLGILRHTEIQPIRKPTHGNCCTCQDCGYSHDECVCEDNEIITAIKKLEKDKACSG